MFDLSKGYDGRIVVEQQSEFPLGNDEAQSYEVIRALELKLELSPLEEEVEYQTAGTITAYLLLGGHATNLGIDIVLAADELDGSVAEAARVALDNDKGSIERELAEEFGDCQPNVLLIEAIYLEPWARGHGIGARFLRRAIDYCDPGSLLVVMIEPEAAPYFGEAAPGEPLHPGDPYAERALAIDGDRRLRAWVRSLGFRAWGKSGYWVVRGECYYAEPLDGSLVPADVADRMLPEAFRYDPDA